MPSTISNDGYDIRNPLSYHPFILLTLITYFVLTLVVYDREAALPEPPIPKNEHSLNGFRAYEDLTMIAQGPHPYNSRLNDVVRAYILKEVRKVGDSYPDVIIDSDEISNVTFQFRSPSWNYFEGNNIIVEIPGTDSKFNENGSILLSAHFDSVSTSFGATDDGMGVASLLELIRYFANSAHRPRRTIIFNINNGEEDGLFGAKTFPRRYYERCIAFVNLEGAGGGGKSLLFQSSSQSIAKYYRKAPFPHASILANDAYSHGVIRSDTDYSIYHKEHGIQGLDIAFSEPRSWYHTFRDQPILTPHGSQWHMLANAAAVVKHLANDKHIKQYKDTPLFFDFLGSGFVSLALLKLNIINVIFLVLCPALLVFTHYLRLSNVRSASTLNMRSGWAVVIISNILTIFLSTILAIIIDVINPFVAYAQSQTILVCFGLFSAFCLHFIIASFESYWVRRKSYFQSELVYNYDTFIFWWLLLLAVEIISWVKKIGSFYFITFFFIGSWISCLLVNLEIYLAGRKRRPFIGGRMASHISENTPLLVNGVTRHEPSAWSWLWVARFLVSIPIQYIVILQQALPLTSLGQEFAAGADTFTAITSYFFVANLSPFLYKVRLQSISVPIIFIAFAIFLLTSCFQFPFRKSLPLKVYFVQELDLLDYNLTTHLIGIKPFLPLVVGYLPSARSQNKTYLPNSIRRDLASVTFQGITPNPVPGTNFSDLLSITVNTFDVQQTKLYFKCEESRVSTLEFDVAVNVTILDRALPFPRPRMWNTTKISLYSRDWNSLYTVGIDRDTSLGPIKVKASCAWSEWKDERIPSLDEVYSNTPDWVSVTKADVGLLYGYKRFTLT